MTASVRFAFDCNRNGQECGNGVCQSNGVCDCTPIADPKSEGFDCGIVTGTFIICYYFLKHDSMSQSVWRRTWRVSLILVSKRIGILDDGRKWFI